MTSQLEAHDGMSGLVDATWLGDALTSSLEMQWDDVKGDKPGYDADGNPVAWARTTIRHFDSNQETIGGVGSSKYQSEGELKVQVFAPGGGGKVLGIRIGEVLKPAFRGQSIGDLWFFRVRLIEVGQDGPWFHHDFIANFRYSEVA